MTAAAQHGGFTPTSISWVVTTRGVATAVAPDAHNASPTHPIYIVEIHGKIPSVTSKPRAGTTSTRHFNTMDIYLDPATGVAIEGRVTNQEHGLTAFGTVHRLPVATGS